MLTATLSNSGCFVFAQSTFGERYVWEARWPDLAQCRDLDPDAMFVSGAAQHEAKRICRGCPVLTECLAEALDTNTEFGVWGGMTERERRSLLLRRPNVTSWRQLFENSRDQLRTG